MNNIIKTLIASVLCVAATTAMAQPPQPDGMTGATHAGQPHHQMHHDGTPSHMMPMHNADLQSCQACFDPRTGAFVVVDSIDCAVDYVAPRDGKLQRIGRYQTDNIVKRHDIKNILHPVSVGFAEGGILFVATAQNDSSYVGFLGLEPDTCGNLPLLSARGFGNPSQAFTIDHDRLIVVGHNAAGYDIHILQLGQNGMGSLDKAQVESLDYRKPKQSERIQQTDPVGLGLTMVAVAVVFISLLCIALILMGSSKLISRFEAKGKEKTHKEKHTKAVANGSSVDDEVYAAIAAAIHLYADEMHDTEDGIITLQKVEREWTPWNAKYYNMNHYFSNANRR